METIKFIDEHNLWFQFFLVVVCIAIYHFNVIIPKFFSKYQIHKKFLTEDKVNAAFSEMDKKLEREIDSIKVTLKEHPTNKDLKNFEDQMNLKFTNADEKMTHIAENINIKLDAIKNDLSYLKKS